MSRRFVLVLSAALILAGSLPLLAKDDASDLLDKGRELMAGRDYGRAATVLEDVAKRYPTTPAAAEALLLVGKAHLYAKRPNEAISALERLLERAPKSGWVEKARLLIADAHSMAGRHAAAADLLKRRLEEVESRDYKLMLAEHYLAVARAAHEGKAAEGALQQGETDRDLDRAITYYGKARALLTGEADEPRLTHTIASLQLEAQDPGAAIETLGRFFKRYPDYDDPAGVRLTLGEALVATDNAAPVRKTLRPFTAEDGALVKHPRRPHALELVARSYFNEGNERAVRKGVEIAKQAITEGLAKKRAAELAFEIGDELQGAGLADDAIREFRAFRNAYPKDRQAPDALIQTAQSLETIKQWDHARAEWRRFVGQYPNHREWATAQRRIIDVLYDRAQDLKTAKKPLDAIPAFRAFLAEYPADRRSPTAQYEIAAIFEGAKRYDDALTAYAIVSSRYAGLNRAAAATALYRRAEILRLRKVDLDAAMKTYRELLERFLDRPEAARARAMITRLSARELRVETERVFQLAETPQLKLRTRNLSSLTIQAYPIRLADYFRQKKSIGRIDGVEVRIIKPALTWTHEVVNYGRFRDLEYTVSLEKLKPLATDGGAFIVAIRGEDLQTRTLVVLSDLTLVLKSAPKQALAFVIDEAAQRPARGVEVTFTANGKVVGRGTTDEHGVVDLPLKSRVGRVDAFAKRGEHTAFTGSGSGRSVSFGYQSKAYLYTDRPRYRPGHTVKFKGIARRVIDGVYRTAKGRPIAVRITDSRGAALFSETLKANAHGTISGELAIGRAAPLGTYTINATFDKRSFKTTFEVAEYKKPDMFARVQPKNEAPLIGERVEATVEVGYFFGGPAKNAAVSWRAYRSPFAFDASVYQDYAWFFEDDKTKSTDTGPGQLVAQGTATTDADGKCAIGFDTDSADRSWRYLVVVESKGRGRAVARGSAVLFVTDRAYYAMVRADKKAYQPKEAIRATITTVSARHEPVARTGTVELIRLAKGAQTVVQTASVTTGVDGRSEIELRAPRGGRYRVRYVGEDRRKTRITGSTDVSVAGDAEDLDKQARIVAERETYHIGDTAKLMINTPHAPAWALLTFEGERVLRHRVVRLERRSNSIDAPIEGDYAPNVFVRVAIPTKHELFEAEDELLVFKFLRVTVSADRADYRPGDEARYTIEATDPSGTPVAAEFSLALVDRSLLAISPDTTPGIKRFFYDQKRKRSVNTTSSLAFRYRAKTQKIDPDLLGMEARERLARFRKQSQELAKHMAADKKVAYAGPAGRVPPGNQPVGSLKPPPRPEPTSEALGIEGGAGGKFGGRRGGRRKAPARSKSKEGRFADDFAADTEEPEVEEVHRGFFFGRALERMEGSPATDAALAAVKVRRRFVDTAAWMPHVVTDATGTAVVTVTMPDNLTAWRARAVGVGGDALVGSGDAVCRVSKPLVAKLDLPRFLTHGDRARVSAVLNNNTDREQRYATSLDVKGATAKGNTRQDTAIAAYDAARLDWDLDGSHVGAAVFTLKATTGEGGDTDGTQAAIPCHPFGIPHRVARSATTTENARLEITLPDALIADASRFAMLVSPGYDTVLLDGLDYLAAFPYDCVEQTVSRFLPAVAAAAGLRDLNSADAERRARLDKLVHAGLARLYHMQRPDGGWGWWYSPRRGVAPRGGSDPVISAYATLGLETARRAGFAVDGNVLSRARKHAAAIAKSGSGYDLRVLALHALSVNKAVTVNDLNRAHRFRDRLNAAGLARLALAYQNLGRSRQAATLVDALVGRVTEKDGQAWWTTPTAACGAMTGSTLETTAWALHAILRHEPRHRLVEPALAYVMAHRRGRAFRTTKDTGATLLAIARYLADRGAESADYTLQIVVNGQVAGAIDVRGSRVTKGDRYIVLDERYFKPGKNVVELKKDGPGRLHYSLVADTISPADTVEAKGNLLKVARRYREYRDPSVADGIRPGWTVVEPAFRPKTNDGIEVREAAAGQKVAVHLELSARESAKYVMLEDPIPAGFEVIADSPTGSFDRFERRDDRAVFFFSNVKGKTRVTYVLRATHPGAYRARPAFASPMYEPEVWGRGASATVAILEDESAIDRPKRKPTADELYYGGIAAAARDERASARAMLAKSLEYRLRDQFHDEALAWLVKLELDNAPRDAVSRYESLQDRNPRKAKFPRPTRVRLAHAYHGLAEHERAGAAYRDLLRESFEHEKAVARSYVDLGDPVRAQMVLARILQRYPDANTVVSAWYQRSLDFAKIPHPDRKPDPYLNIAAPTMKVQAMRELKLFTSFYPESPLADDAHHEVIKLAASLEVHDRAIDEANRFLRRYDRSKWRDDVSYLAVASLYASGKYDDALATGRPLVDKKIPREDGRRGMVWSPWRDDTIYLFAKVHHIRGELDQAVALYRKVSRKFTDARDAVSFFTRKELDAPATLAVTVGARVALPVEVKNLSKIHADVYPVDLDTLFALRKNLATVNAIDLTGLPPVATFDRTFTGVRPFTRTKLQFDLGLEKPGVYLVVMDADDRAASTVVLISDLDVKVQRTKGRIRVYVTRRSTGDPVPEAMVRIGDGRRVVHEGRTDPRGVYDGAAPRGLAAVVVERDGQHAFHQESKR